LVPQLAPLLGRILRDGVYVRFANVAIPIPALAG
jgi:hypothetical protein